jgi:prepilin-type processing-associated H-X9-DG protein
MWRLGEFMKFNHPYNTGGTGGVGGDPRGVITVCKAARSNLPDYPVVVNSYTMAFKCVGFRKKTNKAYKKRINIKRQSEVILFADGEILPNLCYCMAGMAYPTYRLGSPDQWDDGWKQVDWARHDRSRKYRSNFLFLDNHVDFLGKDEITKDMIGTQADVYDW